MARLTLASEGLHPERPGKAGIPPKMLGLRLNAVAVNKTCVCPFGEGYVFYACPSQESVTRPFLLSSLLPNQ